MKHPHPTTLRRLLTGLLLLGLLFSAGCAQMQQTAGSGGLQLPPIVNQPTARHHPGKFVWHDLLTPDTLASRTFYSELLGWSYREKDGYVEIYQGRRKIGGMLELQVPEGKPVDAQWLAALSVPDVDVAAAQVPELGGKVINGPMDLGPRGRGLLIQDPAGGQLLLLHSATGDPQDREPGIGEWLWNEAWTLDPERLAGFYKPLGHYEATERGPDYIVLINEGHWRAGIRAIKDPRYAGRWVPVVRVADPAALLPKVEALGGVVWVRPGENGTNRDTALISDDHGAFLMLQRWDFPEAGGER
jgi:predicted enzyme related to lactoylglutathione lyase